ncbi:hypothetical protein BRY75_13660 [Acinetobacter baumannii]|nr:hypothetical protein BRY75_13660 [Acinetobacter baumannii]
MPVPDIFTNRKGTLFLDEIGKIPLELKVNYYVSYKKVRLSISVKKEHAMAMSESLLTLTRILKKK